MEGSYGWYHQAKARGGQRNPSFLHVHQLLFYNSIKGPVNGEGSSPSRQFLYIRWEWHYEEKGAAVDGVHEVEDVAKQMFSWLW
jgi:hypothetical protein